MRVGAFPGDVRPRAWIFDGVLTVQVPAVLSYHDRYSMSPLPEDPTPAVSTRYRKPVGAATRSPSMSRAGLRGWVVTGVPWYPRYKTSTRL
jgi:hypothetical protein